MEVLAVAVALLVGGSLVGYVLYLQKQNNDLKELENNRSKSISGVTPKAKDFEAVKSNEKLDSRRVAANPGVVDVGTYLWLSEYKDGFRVDAIESHDSGDDEWVEYKLVEELTGKELYLSAELDDDDCWVWGMNEKVDVKDVPQFASLKFGDKPPKQSFEYGGKTWMYDEDEYNFTVHVKDKLLKRPEEKQWKAKVTEYYNRDNEDEVLVLELWDGGGFVTMGKPYEGDVSVLTT